MNVLVVSHLYPTPENDRALFVHRQCLALRELGAVGDELVAKPADHA